MDGTRLIESLRPQQPKGQVDEAVFYICDGEFGDCADGV